MAGYRRFVAYVYEYRKGRKEANCGFIRVEVRDQRCRLEVHLRCPGLTPMVECRIYGFVRNKGLMDGSLISVCRTREGGVEHAIETSALNMGNSGVSLGRMGGILLRTESGAFFGTEWDDQSIRPENFREVYSGTPFREDGAAGLAGTEKETASGDTVPAVDAGESFRSDEKVEEQAEELTWSSERAEELRSEETAEKQAEELIRSSDETEELSRSEEKTEEQAEELIRNREETEESSKSEEKTEEQAEKLVRNGEETASGESSRNEEKTAGTEAQAEKGEEASAGMEGEQQETAAFPVQTGKALEKERTTEETAVQSQEILPQMVPVIQEKNADAPASAEESQSEPEKQEISSMQNSEMCVDHPDGDSLKLRADYPDIRNPELCANYLDIQNPELRADRPDVQNPGMPLDGPDVQNSGMRTGRPNVQNSGMRTGRPNVQNSGMRLGRSDVQRPGMRVSRAAMQNMGMRPAPPAMPPREEAPQSGHPQEAAPCPVPPQPELRQSVPSRLQPPEEASESPERNFPGEPCEPFSDGFITDCRRIQIQDLRMLDRRDRALGGNRFLQHGYYSFGHLLLGKTVSGQYILGVPGGYDQQERFMANMFGFPYFRESPRISVPGGRGGYWYRSVNSPDFH